LEKDLFIFWAIICLGLISVVGFFWTKTKGFGRFTTATLLILLVLIISSLLALNDSLDKNVIGNILFAIMGFSGGLFIKESKNDD